MARVLTTQMKRFPCKLWATVGPLVQGRHTSGSDIFIKSDIFSDGNRFNDDDSINGGGSFTA